MAIFNVGKDDSQGNASIVEPDGWLLCHNGWLWCGEAKSMFWMTAVFIGSGS